MLSQTTAACSCILRIDCQAPKYPVLSKRSLSTNGASISIHLLQRTVQWWLGSEPLPSLQSVKCSFQHVLVKSIMSSCHCRCLLLCQLDYSNSGHVRSSVNPFLARIRKDLACRGRTIAIQIKSDHQSIILSLSFVKPWPAACVHLCQSSKLSHFTCFSVSDVFNFATAWSCSSFAA